MSFSFKNVGHAIATVAHDIVKGAKAVEKVIAAVAAQGQKLEPTIEFMTGLVDPAAVPLERAAFAALGLLAKAAADTDAAAAQKFFGQDLDAAMWEDFKKVYATLSSKAGFLGTPTAPAIAFAAAPQE